MTIKHDAWSSYAISRNPETGRVRFLALGHESKKHQIKNKEGE